MRWGGLAEGGGKCPNQTPTLAQVEEVIICLHDKITHVTPVSSALHIIAGQAILLSVRAFSLHVENL